MRPPRFVDVVGKRYSIEPMEGGPGSGPIGLCVDTQCKILYTADQADQQLQDTVLHELLHAIDYAMALELTERQVQAMSAGVLQVLQANPEFTRWLIRRKKA